MTENEEASESASKDAQSRRRVSERAKVLTVTARRWQEGEQKKKLRAKNDSKDHNDLTC